MIISFDKLASATRGILRAEERGGEAVFHRFTEEQEAFYKRNKPNFYEKTFGTASMVIDFTTDSHEVSFEYTAKKASGRLWFYFDIYENDRLVQHVGKDGAPTAYGKVTATLSEGEKRVRIYLPALFAARISKFTIDDGASFLPSEKGRCAIIYGDSITQGYDAKFPSLSYANIIADTFGLNAINQAIGGEIFTLGILLGAPELQPEVITVAYGTNDWVFSAREDTLECAEKFFKMLESLYPCAKIVYISPIWRADTESRGAKGGDFFKLVEKLEEVAKKCGASVISGLDFFPRDTGMFSDGSLHPNDLGFSLYAKGVIERLKELI